MSKAPFRGNATPQDVHQVSQLARRSKPATAVSISSKASSPASVKAFSGSLTFAASPPLQYDGAIVFIPEADAGSNGYLSAADWTAFDAKEPALGAPDTDGQILASTVAQARSWISLPTFVDAETPVGTINGTNTIFTLANAPTPNSLHVYLGASPSALQRLASTQYSVTGSTLTFNVAPAIGSTLLIDYRY